MAAELRDRRTGTRKREAGSGTWGLAVLVSCFLVPVSWFLFAPAHAETRPDYGGTVSASLLGEPASLDPVDARSHAEVTVVGLVFDTLYRQAADGGIVPHLAAAMPEEAGEGRVRIRVRSGVVFHDGRAVGAADVAASLKRLAASDAGWLLAAVSQIDASGDAIELTAADTGELAAMLSAPQAAITPDGKAPSAKAPIGSGPFRVDTIDRKKGRITLTASDDHFAGRPHVDTVELRWFADAEAEAGAFEEGKLQVSARGATVFAGARPKYKADVAEGPATVLSYVGFGRAHAAITGDKDFRRALDLALARAGLASSGTGERVTPTADPLPVDLGGEALTEDRAGGDTAAAAKALKAAAKRVSALASPPTLVIFVDETRLDDHAIAERVVRALDKLGISASITELDAADLLAKLAAGKGDLYIGQLAAPGSSASLLWGAAFAAGGDAWAQTQLARGPLDAAKARKEFASRLPIVPLAHRAVRVHHRTDVRGVAFDASSRLAFADLFLFGKPVKTKK